MRIELRITDCTPDEARMITTYVEMISRPADVERTAAELAPMITPPSPPAVQPPAPPVAHVAPVPGPTPPPPPAAPASPPAPPRVPVQTGALDVRGVPWHPEYHAATQGRNNDGSWKKKKGGDKHATSAYELQYIGRPAAQQPPAAPPAPPVHAAPVSPPISPTAEELNARFAPEAAAAPVNGIMPPPAPPASAPTYAEFYALYMQLCEQGKATAADFETVHQRAGAANPAEYISDEGKRMLAYLEFQRLAA